MSEKREPVNVLKVRDDHVPLQFSSVGDKFKLLAGTEASWLNTEEFGYKELRNRIEPWLTSLFQSEHLSVLAGSGLTHAVHYLAAGKGAAGMGALTLSHYQTEITDAAKKAAEAAGRAQGNLEDQLRVANELLRGLEILQKNDEAKALRQELQTGMQAFAQSILAGEAGIATAEEEMREHAFNILVTFLMSFASRTGVRDRLNIFTTNYDRLIEAGAELAGLHLLDRFLGKLMPIFPLFATGSGHALQPARHSWRTALSGRCGPLHQAARLGGLGADGQGHSPYRIAVWGRQRCPLFASTRIGRSQRMS
jgi:hypothetical protein